MNAPIRIPCEGSGVPLTKIGSCSMCGRFPGLGVGGARPHDRDDIIAMIRRGDFDAVTISREEQDHQAEHLREEER